MSRISTASWIALAAAAAIAFAVFILGHGGGRKSEAETTAPTSTSRREKASPSSSPGAARVIEGLVKGISATKLPGHVTAIPVWPPNAFPRAVTADVQPDGSFRVGPLEHAVHKVEIDINSYTPILVEEAHPRDRIEVEASPGIPVVGSVRTVDGVPIPRASVWGIYPRPFIGRRLAICDAEGRFRLPAMPPGTLHVFAEAERFAPALTVVELTEELSGRQDPVHIDIFLGRGTDLVGLVRSRDTGEVLSNATVLAWKFTPADLCESNESLLLQRARTGPDGFFRLPKLPSSRIRGWVSASGQASASFDVPLSSDWRTERADVDLAVAGRATVRIVSEKGEPQVDVEVEAATGSTPSPTEPESTASAPPPPLPREMRVARRRRSDANGQCTFEDLRTDRYVYFELPDAADRLPRYSLESFWPVPGKLVSAADFRVHAGGRALARVLFGENQSAAFAHVRYAGRSFLADDAGIVRVDGIDGSNAVVEIDHPRAAPTTVAVAMATAKEVSGLRWVLDAGSELTGRILESVSGDAIGAATVSVRGSSPFAWTRRVQTDGDGAFRVLGLGAAPWSVEVTARRFGMRRVELSTAPAAPLTLSLEQRAP